MPDNSKLELPGKFESGRRYLISGDTLLAWKKALMEDRAVAGPGIQVSGTPQGRIFTATAQGGGVEAAETTGPFCKTFRDGGSWRLLGGTVTGGDGNETIAEINLGSVASPPADGTFHWLRVSLRAEEEDGVLLPGGELTGARDGSGRSLPSNSMPTVSSTNGVIYISLGQWNNGIFEPAGCGNIQVRHCPGTISYTRG